MGPMASPFLQSSYVPSLPPPGHLLQGQILFNPHSQDEENDDEDKGSIRDSDVMNNLAGITLHRESAR